MNTNSPRRARPLRRQGVDAILDVSCASMAPCGVWIHDHRWSGVCQIVWNV